MLRYTINRRDANTNLRKLDVAWYSKNFDDADIGEVEDLTLDERDKLGYTIVVTCNTPHNLTVDDRVAMTVSREVAETFGEESNLHNFYQEYPVASVSQDGITLSFVADAYYKLYGTKAFIRDVTFPAEYTVSGNDGKEHSYSVEERRRYIYFYFEYDHFFPSDPIVTNIFHITTPYENEWNGTKTLSLTAEYVARNVMRVWVPESGNVNDDNDKISVYNIRVPVSDFSCDEGMEQQCRDGEVYCGEEGTVYKCEDSSVYYEDVKYYYENVTINSKYGHDDNDGHPWVDITQERIEENGDNYVLVVKTDGSQSLWEPCSGDYIDNFTCEGGGEWECRNGEVYCGDTQVPYYACDGQGVFYNPEDCEDLFGDGDLYRELTAEEYNYLDAYKFTENNETGNKVYIKDYAYIYTGDSAYHLLSDYERYSEQERLYPTDGSESDEWVLNHSWFGDNAEALAEVNLEPYIIYRPTFLFDGYTLGGDEAIIFSAVRSMCSLDLPMSQCFSTDMNNEAFTEEFIAYEREKAINPVREMEKNVYHPMVSYGDGNFSDVAHIQFNLHFRRRDENWNVVQGGFWNGVKIGSDGKPAIQADYFPTSTVDKGNVVKDVERYSDLLSFAGFTNNDVRYQKNVLKKSFLRLSFYDSDDETSQRLLAYYTIFYDSGRAFKRFAQNFDTSLYIGDSNHTSWGWDGAYKIIGGYKKFCDSDDPTDCKWKYDVSGDTGVYGIRVSRDVKYTMPDTKPEKFYDNIEEHRLSTQFTVDSRSTSMSSSEGFYVYLWKDDYNPPYGIGSCEAEEIYMRVDFNHAGYGRTIPFMMPYANTKVSSFSEILGQWSETPETNDFNRFREYAYIKLKRGYDTDKDRFFYYPDPAVYGNAKDSLYYDSETDTLLYNLYEGKIYEGE